MIFYSFNQLNNFLIFIFSGFVVAIFNSVLEIIFLINSKKNLKNIVYRCIFYIFFAILFIFLLNLFRYFKLITFAGNDYWFYLAKKAR